MTSVVSHPIMYDAVQRTYVLYEQLRRMQDAGVVSPHGIAMPKGLYFTAVVFSFFFGA